MFLKGKERSLLDKLFLTFGLEQLKNCLHFYISLNFFKKLLYGFDEVVAAICFYIKQIDDRWIDRCGNTYIVMKCFRIVHIYSVAKKENGKVLSTFIHLKKGFLTLCDL